MAYRNNIFAGTDPNSCYVSTNNGTSWTQKIDGFPVSSYITVRAFCILNDYVFVGTANSSVMVSTEDLLSELVGIEPISSEVPSQFSLSQNILTFNPSTKIKFEIPSERGVRRTGCVNILLSMIFSAEKLQLS
jgi:hypothetical protein